MTHFRLRAAFCPNTSLLVGHEVTASLPLRASFSNKIRPGFETGHNPTGLL